METLLTLAVKWYNQSELDKKKHFCADSLKRRVQSNMDKRKNKLPQLPYPSNYSQHKTE